MAVYRYQCVSVGWWRGKIKRWNTTFYSSSSSITPSIKAIMSKMGYPNPGDALGDCSGGIASIAVYNAAGGAPIVQTVYFDWQMPTTWVPYTGEVWASVPAGTPLDASGESALVVVGQLPGLSVTGKPMTTRKYFHAIPSRTAADYADPDVSPAVQAAILPVLPTSVMGTKAGKAPTTVTVEPYYLSHQRVRGRRRPVTTVAAQSFSAGVLAGAATAGGGGGTAPQFQ